MWCSCTNCSVKHLSFSQPRIEHRGETPAEDTSLLSRRRRAWPGRIPASALEGANQKDAQNAQACIRGLGSRVSGPRDSRRGSCTWPLVWKFPPWSHRHGSQSTLVTTHRSCLHRGSPTPQTSPRYPPPRPTLPSAHGSSHQCWVLLTEGGTLGTALLCPAAHNTLEPDKLTDTLALTSGRWPRRLHVQAF